MKKIIFLLEYGALPIWVQSEDGELIYVGLPEDMTGNAELVNLIEEIAKEYDSLFINNSIEFSFRGFLSEEDEKCFDQKVHKAIGLLMEEAQGKYHVKVDGCYENDYK